MAGSIQYQSEEMGAGIISEINVTPLVDVTLVLLIIFMVTTQMIVERDRGISIERPKTATGMEVKDSPLAVTIDDKRVLHIGGRPYTDMAEARLAINAAVQADPDVKAIIAADKNVPHGDVMTAIDMVKEAGVTKFALASDPLPPKEPE